MGSPDRRARHREETRAMILSAARELAASDGYEAITVRRIAERIEYTPAALYRHYPSKSEILAALMAADYDALARELYAHADAPDPIERIRRGGRVYVEFAVADLDRYRMMFLSPLELEEAHLGRAVRESPGDAAYSFFRTAVQQAVASLRFRPELTDVDIVTQIIWGGLHGIVALHAARTHDTNIGWRPVRQSAALLVDSMLRGLTRLHAL